MIRRTDRLDVVAPRAEIRERLQPDVEDAADLLIVLQIPAVDRAGAVVDVEVDVEFVARRPVRVARKMLGGPRLRSKEPLLLAAPERDADRPPRPRADRMEDAHGLDHRCR